MHPTLFDASVRPGHAIETFGSLLTFDAGSEDLEDGGDAEPDCGPVVLSFDRAAAKRVYRGRQSPRQADGPFLIVAPPATACGSSWAKPALTRPS